jgi:putative phosphoesterase
MLIGLIADTHGTLDSRVRPAFAGVDLILHAGDIGSEQVLAGLAEIAPVTAVAGNNDLHLANLGLPLRANVVLDGARIHLVHRLQDAQPRAETNVVVYGHSHKALVTERDGRLYANPGAAGRVGFHREITLGLLHIDGEACRVEIVSLGSRSAARGKGVRS